MESVSCTLLMLRAYVCISKYFGYVNVCMIYEFKLAIAAKHDPHSLVRSGN